MSGAADQSGRQEDARQDAAELVQRALAALDAEDRALMEGFYFEDVPLKEMSATLGWSLVKTKVRAHRARRKLRTIIQAILTSQVKT